LGSGGLGWVMVAVEVGVEVCCGCCWGRVFCDVLEFCEG
jgi:hypothetical protein